jgi:hypothetical protein
MINTDKACVVEMPGGTQAYPIYGSMGNIHSRVRSKYLADAWVLLGYIPVAKWLHKKKTDLQDLNARLYHKSMSILFEPLIQLARQPEKWTDPEGEQRLVIPILMSMPLDHPEQRVVACVRASTSPLSDAATDEFGQPKLFPLRRGRDTLRVLRKLAERYDPDDIIAFGRKCGKYNLLGVPDPFWAEWFAADPCEFLSPDTLHLFNVFFRDNALPWIISMSTSLVELDLRHQIQPVRVGVRRFSNGITKLQKVAGTEMRDLQRIVVVASRGIEGISKGASTALRAILDIIFICRYPSHDEGTIALLEEALSRFHAHKKALVDCGACSDSFRIPKLEKMQHVPRQIRQLGAVQQYSTEVTEHAHQQSCSESFAASNHKEYLAQMARYRDRLEKAKLAPHYVAWKTSVNRMEQQRSSGDDSDDENTLDNDEELAALESMVYTFDERDYFASGHNPKLRRYIYGEVAIRLIPQRPNPLYRPVADVIVKHGAEYFHRAFYHFTTRSQRAPPPDYQLPFHSMTVWGGLRLQRRSLHDSDILVQPVTLRTMPSSAQRPNGQFDPVLICSQDTNIIGLQGSYFLLVCGSSSTYRQDRQAMISYSFA